MISRQLPELAGKATGAVGQNDFGFAVATGVEENFTRGRVARRILKSNGFAILFENKIAQGDPAAFARPAHVDEFLPIGQQLQERCNGDWGFWVRLGSKMKAAGFDVNIHFLERALS